MPTYEFRCSECGVEFTKVMKMEDDRDGMVCLECNSPNVKRVYSVVAVKTSKKS